MRIALKWLAVGVLPALASACFSSSSGSTDTDSGSGSDSASDDVAAPGSDGASPEAAPGTKSDAAAEASADASASDATLDGPADGHAGDASGAETSVPGEASVPTVTVVVRSALGLEPGVNVVFEDGYGQVLATTYTDANGTLSQAVPAGSQVTVLMGTLDAPQIVTIQAVAPGDVLQFFDQADSASVGNPQVAVSVDPDSGMPAATNNVRGWIGQCSFAAPGSAYLQPRCLGSTAQFPILAIAQAGADGGYADLAYTFLKGNHLAPDDAGVTSVTLPGPWYTDIATQTIGLVNASPGATYSDLSVGGVADGVSVAGTNYSTTVTYQPSPTNQVDVYPQFFDDLQEEANVSTNGSYGLGVSGIVTRGLGDGGTRTFDMTQALPLIDAVAVSTAIPSQPIITWSSSHGSFAGANGVVAQVSWRDTGSSGTINGTWTLVAPGTVSSITAPAVSNIVASRVPSASAIMATPVVMVVEADFAPSYDALRVQPGVLALTPQLLGGGSGAPEAPLLPVDGTLKYSAVTVNGD